MQFRVFVCLCLVNFDGDRRNVTQLDLGYLLQFCVSLPARNWCLVEAKQTRRNVVNVVATYSTALIDWHAALRGPSLAGEPGWSSPPETRAGGGERFPASAPPPDGLHLVSRPIKHKQSKIFIIYPFHILHERVITIILNHYLFIFLHTLYVARD